MRTLESLARIELGAQGGGDDNANRLGWVLPSPPADVISHMRRREWWYGKAADPGPQPPRSRSVTGRIGAQNLTG